MGRDTSEGDQEWNSESARAKAKRDTIRAGARRLFLELGYERATMDAIAATAGVSKQTLYRYYATKEALFVDILRQLTIGRFLPEVPALAAGSLISSRADLEEALVGFATGASEQLMAPEYVALLRTLIAVAPQFPQIAELMRGSLVRQGSAALASLLTRAHEAGAIRQPPSEEVLLFFVAPFLAYLLADGLISGEAEPTKPSPATITTLVRLFLNAVT